MGSRVRLVGTVVRPGEPEFELFFEFPREFGDFVRVSADPFAVAMLIPAMSAGESLELRPPISVQLSEQLPIVRDIYHRWFPSFSASPILAQVDNDAILSRPDRAATFFSGGVDSLYTALKRLGPDPLRAPLTHLIFMEGMETPLEQVKGISESRHRVDRIAEKLGVTTISGCTNVRTFFKRHWERYFVGSGLAATAQALSGGLGTVCIPSSFCYATPVPQGSTPLTDALFSTEAQRIVHDGAESDRSEKLAKAMEWNRDLVLQNLRVCLDNNGGDYNCGKCYKCVRTAVILHVLGALDDAEMFELRSSSHWKRVLATDSPHFNREALNFAISHGADPKVTKLLRGVVHRRERQDAMIRIIKNSPLSHLLPLLQRTRDALGVEAREH